MWTNLKIIWKNLTSHFFSPRPFTLNASKRCDGDSKEFCRQFVVKYTNCSISCKRVSRSSLIYEKTFTVSCNPFWNCEHLALWYSFFSIHVSIYFECEWHDCVYLFCCDGAFFSLNICFYYANFEVIQRNFVNEKRYQKLNQKIPSFSMDYMLDEMRISFNNIHRTNKWIVMSPKPNQKKK